ncbi:MAG: hypothetical protein E7286_02435 [Lachnospiraceae bacterium]|nr:hypothetical protein [Lachnospiraceae bacterium]
MIVWILILAVINWVIYHKIFRVLYFDLGKGLVKEFICCFLVAAVEAALIVYVGGALIGLLGSLLAGFLNIVVWLAVFVGAFLIIRKIYRLFKKNKKSKKENSTKDGGIVNAEGVVENIDSESESNQTEESIIPMPIEEVEAYILEHYDAESKVQAIKYYRSATGLGLKEAKDHVDLILEKKAKTGTVQ